MRELDNNTANGANERYVADSHLWEQSRMLREAASQRSHTPASLLLATHICEQCTRLILSKLQYQNTFTYT